MTYKVWKKIKSDKITKDHDKHFVKQLNQLIYVAKNQIRWQICENYIDLHLQHNLYQEE